MSKPTTPQGLSAHVDTVLRMAGEMAEIRYSIAMTGAAPKKVTPYGVLAPYVASTKPQEQEVDNAVLASPNGLL